MGILANRKGDLAHDVADMMSSYLAARHEHSIKYKELASRLSRIPQMEAAKVAAFRLDLTDLELEVYELDFIMQGLVVGAIQKPTAGLQELREKLTFVEILYASNMSYGSGKALLRQVCSELTDIAAIKGNVKVSRELV